MRRGSWLHLRHIRDDMDVFFVEIHSFVQITLNQKIDEEIMY
jgi:hypothetical protein